MNPTPNELLAELQSRGLVGADAVESADAAGASAGPENRPWYIALLLGASGWLAGIFMLVFVALLVHPNEAGNAFLCGIVLVAAAFGLFKVDRSGGAFLGQLALALSMAGQCLLLYAAYSVSHDGRDVQSIAQTALLLQLVMIFVMPNPLHRTLSTLFATMAWARCLPPIIGGIWQSLHLPGPWFVYAVLTWLLTWAPIGWLLWMLIRREPAWMARHRQALVRPAMNGLIVGLAFATLASHVDWSWQSFSDQRALWPLLPAFGALAGLAAAFALRSRALIGVCVVGALLHVSNFYYALGTSLLLKSLLMLVMGGALLLVSRRLAQGAHP